MYVVLGSEALTRAEAAVLALVDSGLSNHQIAGALCISIGTVKSHLHRVYDKLAVRNRTEASARAREQGRLPLSPASPVQTQR